MRDIEFGLRGDFIPLDALLKATGLADSGGRARAMVAQGLVQVDGTTELRKTRKLRAGQLVTLADVCIRLRASGDKPEIRDGASSDRLPERELAVLTQFKAADG